MTKVTVSFKKTTRDMKLYLRVSSEEEKSEFVKDALEFYIGHLNKLSKQEGNYV